MIEAKYISAKALRFFFCALFFTFSTQAQDRNEKCSSTPEIEKTLTSRQSTAIALKEGLIKLSKGDTGSPLLAEALFTVELSNEAAVANRVAELRKSTRSDSFDKGLVHLAKCIPNDGALAKQLSELKSVEREVDGLRLSFLGLPTERRQSLLNIHKQASDQEASLKELVAEKQDAEKRSFDADQSLREAELQAQSATNADLREIATSRALLEKRRKEIAELSILWTEQLESLTAKASGITADLSKDAAVLSSPEPHSVDILTQQYHAVRGTWRELVSMLFDRLGTATEARTVPELPSISGNLALRFQESNEIKEYRAAQVEARTELAALALLKDKIDKEEESLLYRTLLTAGRLRAEFIGELSKAGENSQYRLNNDYFADLFREIRLVPYRPIVALKSFALETNEQIGRGVSGILVIAKRLFILFLFVMVPVASLFLLKRLSLYIEGLRSSLVRSRDRSPRSIFWANWIRRINPFLPWLVMLAASGLARKTVEGTDLKGIAEILPYFNYFFLYRILRLAFSEGVIAASRHNPMFAAKGVGPRIEKTAKFIGLFFLITAFLLQATQTIARRGLFFHLIWDVLFYFSPIWLATAAYWWRKEIAVAANDHLHKAIGPRISAGCASKWAWFVCLPASLLIFIVILGKVIIDQLSHFDSAKRVSAQLFRRKIESAAKSRTDKSKGTIPIEYLSFFELGIPSDSSLLVSPETAQFDEISECISNWVNGKSSEHTLAIRGEKGIGKSCLLKLIENHFNNLKVIRVSVPGKMTTPEELYTYLGESLGFDLREGAKALAKHDETAPKTLVLIDECQNLFLARRNGFNAFKAFANLCNISTTNFFWCAVINRYSWAYLNAVTSGSQYFRHEFTLDEWSDSDIKTLILGRHEKTGFSLEYDPIIFDMNERRDEGAAQLVQDRYFELLWDQSKGNPRTAIMLWLSALQVIGPQKLRVGLPVETPSRPLAGLTDDELFVIAAVIRHENLSAPEAESVTNLRRATVNHAFQIGLERGFLDCSDKGRFRVKPLWQAPLTQNLEHKNFVNG